MDDRYNGSLRAELTVQHVVGRDPHDEGWRDLQAAVREVTSEGPDWDYIAFIDDRQLAERSAVGIEEARSITWGCSPIAAPCAFGTVLICPAT